MINRMILLPVAAIITGLTMCNPVSEKVPDVICSGLHPKNIIGHCHGAKYTDPLNYCNDAKCHGAALQGGNTGAPSCFSCHANKWDFSKTHTISLGGRRHHFNVVEGNPAAYCTGSSCHGTDLTVGNSPRGGPSCLNCHDSIPTGGPYLSTHTVILEGQRHHSKVTQGNFTVNCTGSLCHGSNLSVGNKPDYGPPCTQCHESVPTEGGDDR